MTIKVYELMTLIDSHANCVLVICPSWICRLSAACTWNLQKAVQAYLGMIIFIFLNSWTSKIYLNVDILSKTMQVFVFEKFVDNLNL